MSPNNNEPNEELSYFDKVAKSWDRNPVRVELAKLVVHAIMEQIPIDDTMLMMDFGCGSGLISLQLAPKVAFVTAADRSTGMLSVLAENMKGLGINNVKALDFKDNMHFNLQGKYNLITAGMLLHHISDIDEQLNQFHGWNSKQGWLAVSDLEPENGSFHESEAGTEHPGVDPRKLADKLEKIGYTVKNISRVYTIEKKGINYPVFLLIAQKQ